MRQLINKYAYYLIGAAVVLAAAIFFFTGAKPPMAAKDAKAFYVDEETGDETILTADQLPPVVGKTGKPTLVQAVKFTRDGGKTVTTTYLLKYTDQALADLKTMSPDDTRRQDLLDSGLLIREPGLGHNWVPYTSPEGNNIRVSFPIPGDGPIEQVFPK